MIDSISVTEFGGVPLSVFHTSTIEDGTNEYYYWRLGDVVEVIGSLDGFLGYASNMCLGGDPGHFRCYTDSNLFAQTSIEDCDFLLTSLENPSLKKSYLYPNPASDVLFLNHYNEIGEVLHFEIISIDGKSLLSGTLANNLIDVSGLIPGFYHVKLSSSNSTVI